MAVMVTTPSRLEQFVIRFEHDLTWGEVRKRLRARRKKVDKRPKQG